MAKRKRAHSGTHSSKRRKRVSCIADVLHLECGGQVFYRVYNSTGKLLFHAAKPLLQKLSRDVVNALVYRWEKDQGCRPLNTHNVRVRDHQAFLPREGSRHDSKDYPMLFLRFLQSIFNPVQGAYGTPDYGFASNVRTREDIYEKLCTPHLTLDQFRNLYFHMFLQTEEELCDFPANAVWNLRNTKFNGNGCEEKWIDAYRSWDDQHDREEINLFFTSLRSMHVWRVYHDYRTYRDDDPVDEAELVRNGITHFNQDLLPPDFFDKRQIGKIFFDLFPNVGFRLYDFMWDSGVNMDFTMSRTCYSA